jgi:hypothetical protein
MGPSVGPAVHTGKATRTIVTSPVVPTLLGFSQWTQNLPVRGYPHATRSYLR